MKYLKTYEELSPELLDKAAGDRDTPQKKRIGSEADRRKKMEDPEYVAALNKKKEEENAEAEKSKRLAEKSKRFSEAFKKHFVDGSYGKGATIEFYLKTVEQDSERKIVSVIPIYAYIQGQARYCSFELYLGSEDDNLYVDGEFEENGTIVLDDDQVEKMVEYYKKDRRRIKEVDFRNVVEFSIIGVELKTAVGFADVINAIYGTKLTKNDMKISGRYEEKEGKKLGILNKDFEECRHYSEDTDEDYEKQDFESNVKKLAPYGFTFYTN